MFLYGLKASGTDSISGDSFNIYSKRLFKTYEKSKQYEEVFKQRCCSNDYIESLDSEEPISVQVIQYLIDETI